MQPFANTKAHCQPWQAVPPISGKTAQDPIDAKRILSNLENQKGMRSIPKVGPLVFNLVLIFGVGKVYDIS